MQRLTAARSWSYVIGLCVLVRLAFPLAALAAEGSRLPGMPRFRFGPFYGDANGYYAAARELVATSARTAPAIAATAILGTLAFFLSRRRGVGRLWLLFVGAGTLALMAALVVRGMQPSGAPVVGWPLVWAVGLAPLRVVDPGLGPDAAFAVGLALSLVAIACTVVATAYVGLWSSGRRSVGLLAAVIFALWPFIPGLVVGPRGWENGTWFVDTGLHLYTEPLSTALVVGAVALLLHPRPGDMLTASAGLALGFATTVKLTDGLIAIALVCVLVVARHWRRAVIVAIGGVLSAPIVIFYWDKGYVGTYDGRIADTDRPWSLHYVGAAWGDSLLFTPLLDALLVLPALLGLAHLRSAYARAMIAVPIVVTVVVYSVYYVTALHPRFLYVGLPLVFVLDAAAVVGIVTARRQGSSVGDESVRVV